MARRRGIAAIASFFLFLHRLRARAGRDGYAVHHLAGRHWRFCATTSRAGEYLRGDSGSLLPGRHDRRHRSWASCARPRSSCWRLPLVIAAIPIADTAAIIRRVLHQPIQQADRKHLAAIARAKATACFPTSSSSAHGRGAAGRGRLGYEQYPRCCGVGYDRHHAAGVVLDTVAPRHLRSGSAPPLPRPPHPPRRQAPLVRKARAVGKRRALTFHNIS